MAGWWLPLLLPLEPPDQDETCRIPGKKSGLVGQSQCLVSDCVPEGPWAPQPLFQLFSGEKAAYSRLSVYHSMLPTSVLAFFGHYSKKQQWFSWIVWSSPVLRDDISPYALYVTPVPTDMAPVLLCVSVPLAFPCPSEFHCLSPLAGSPSPWSSAHGCGFRNLDPIFVGQVRAVISPVEMWVTRAVPWGFLLWDNLWNHVVEEQGPCVGPIQGVST